MSVDDALMGITHVIRAEEHLTNTLRQCLILEALGYKQPQYAHCSLILGEDRSKLSKRHGATSVDQFKQEVRHESKGPRQSRARRERTGCRRVYSSKASTVLSLSLVIFMCVSVCVTRAFCRWPCSTTWRCSGGTTPRSRRSSRYVNTISLSMDGWMDESDRQTCFYALMDWWYRERQPRDTRACQLRPLRLTCRLMCGSNRWPAA